MIPFVFLKCVCVCPSVRLWKAEYNTNTKGSVPSFHQVSSGDQTQVLSLGSPVPLPAEPSRQPKTPFLKNRRRPFPLISLTVSTVLNVQPKETGSEAIAFII